MFKKEVKEFCKKNGITILRKTEFPPLLKAIHDPPACLFIKGNKEILFSSCLAVVGARKSSSYGVRSAIHFSKKLSEEGFTIVSGLARGIDSAAHKGTLMGGQKTIAVLAHGHDQIYPRDNIFLANEIVEKGGAVVSEYPPFTGCQRQYFVARNRIVAGLSLGVVVIEASEKSGSLITANFANDEGRDVFVVPGPYDDSNYQGSHELIQNGAKLVQSVEDVLSEFESLKARHKNVELSKEDQFFRKELKNEFSFQDLYELGSEMDFQPALELKKWLDNKRVAEISPQVYMWLK